MNGGSFAHMFRAEVSEIGEYIEELRRMAAQLTEFPEGARAVKRTQEVLDRIDGLGEILDELRGVWLAVEWYDSGNFDAAHVNEMLKSYNRAHLKVPRRAGTVDEDPTASEVAP